MRLIYDRTRRRNSDSTVCSNSIKEPCQQRDFQEEEFLFLLQTLSERLKLSSEPERYKKRFESYSVEPIGTEVKLNWIYERSGEKTYKTIL